MSRFKSVALYTTAAICVLLALTALFFVIEGRRTQLETGAVLSAFFSQVVLNDVDKSVPEHRITIVVMRNPECALCSIEGGEFNRQFWFGRSWKSRASLLSEAWFAQASRATRVSFLVNSVFSTDVSADLTLPKRARAVFISPT